MQNSFAIFTQELPATRSLLLISFLIARQPGRLQNNFCFIFSVSSLGWSYARLIWKVRSKVWLRASQPSQWKIYFPEEKRLNVWLWGGVSASSLLSKWYDISVSFKTLLIELWRRKTNFKVVSAFSSASVDSLQYQYVEQLILQHNKTEI